MNHRSLLKDQATLLEHMLRILDPLILAVVGLGLFHIQFRHINLPGHYIWALFAASFFSLAVFPFFKIYRSQRGYSLWDEIHALSSAWLTVVLLLVLIMFGSKTSADFSRQWLGLWVGTGFVALWGSHAMLRFVLRFFRRRGLNLRHIVIVGAGKLGRSVAEKLQNAPWSGLQVVGFYDDAPSLQHQQVLGIEVRGMLDKLDADLQRDGVDQVWIALPLRAEDRMKALLHDLRHHTVEIRFVPDIYGFQLLNHSLTEVAGLPVINLTESPMQGANSVVKLLEDQIIAILILILLSPLMLILAIGVKLSSPGPIFYRQERVTWNGAHFNILKFRSMPVDAEKGSGAVWSVPGEKRATLFGAFIRRWSLDELPQFINVLKGEMSIVGPRPERPEFVEKFKDQIPGYMQKHLVKAGITGWAQVNDLRGNTDLGKRIEHDLYYIENWSLWFDLRIIFLTVFTVFSSRHAY